MTGFNAEGLAALSASLIHFAVASKYTTSLRQSLRPSMPIEITALSRSSLYAYMAAGTFPAAIKISERSIAWEENAVREWVAARIAAHRKPQQSAEAVSLGF
jgi:prophage regulatory protein